MSKHFGNNSFMKFHAQGLEQYPLHNAYKKEEESFLKTVRRLHLSQVPCNRNIVSSRVLYTLKTDDESFMLKARIAPQCNEDSLKQTLKTECSICSPTGIWLVFVVCFVFQEHIAKVDVKSAFLQTECAERHVYVIPPRKASDRSHNWLLLTAPYGPVNANAKWQSESAGIFGCFNWIKLL